MKRLYLIIPALLICCLFSKAQRLSGLPEITAAGKGRVIPYADNIGYWKEMVRLGYVKPQKLLPWVAPKPGSSCIRTVGLAPLDSPDVPVTGNTGLTQSENSVFIDPGDENNVLNSNNSTDWDQGSVQNAFGADSYSSSDNGLSWGGSFEGAGKANSGDPATAISRDGRWYVGKINNTYGQSVACSSDHGNTWHEVQVAPGPVNVYGLLDKNHLWVDNSTVSPFGGNVYIAWTNFISGSADTNQVQVSASNDGGLHWSSAYAVSREVNAGKFNHGVNIATGPEGQVYLAWSIYDTWPGDETAIGFTVSFNGGGIWQASHRIISNIKGIRNSMTAKAMRVNSFPSMAVDQSNGPNRGTIYLVWANVGSPGINTGDEINIYMIRSADKGDTWSAPVKINQDAPGLGKEHYFPWITVDAVTGGICVIYYDDRNVSATGAETWVSYSYDGGNSFTDFRVSDVSFTPVPIPGLAMNYFGDYIGIQSLNMKVYPVWTDNRLPGGQTMTWTSPFVLGPAPGQAWVMYYSNELSSIAKGGPAVLKYGDSLHLSLGVKNTGDLFANGLVVKVTSPSPYLTMTDSLEPCSPVVAGGTETIPDGFAFKVSDTIPDNIKVRFDVQVSNADTTWNSHFALDSHAPGMTIGNLVIDDASAGNNNGRFDPGETDDVVITISNTGSYACPGTSCRINTDSQFLNLLNDVVFTDTIEPSRSVNLHYTVSVSDSAPTSAGADLFCRAGSDKYIRYKEFRQIIGMVAEDWETDSFTKFPWTNGGNKAWTITGVNPFEGSFSAVSGNVSDQQSSWVYVTYTSASDDSISFYFKTSSEQDYDFLDFFIDNTLQGQWSGENPWARVSFPVTAGTHIYKWIYQKDVFASGGSDQAGLDFIIFPAPVVPWITIKPEDTICAGNTCTLQATVNQYDSLRWFTYGDGSFTNAVIAEPVYNPGSNDIIRGRADLRLTAFSRYGRNIKTMRLTIARLPVAEISVFPKDTVCEWQTISLTADTTNVHSYLWTPGELTTSSVIIDTSIAGGIGTKIFRLKTLNTAGCYKTDSVWLTFKDCLGIADFKGNFSVNLYPNPSSGQFTLDIYTPLKEIIGISIEDFQQKLVFEERDIRVSGRLIKSFNFAGLSPGMFIMNIKRKDEMISRKLLISR